MQSNDEPRPPARDGEPALADGRSARPRRPSGAEIGTRQRRIALGAVFAGALALRAAHAWQIQHSPIGQFLLGDAATYDEWARRLAGGDWIGNETFDQAPLYPYFLGVLYLFDDGLAWVRGVQAVLGAASCSLLAAAGWRWISPAAGVVAGAMLAVYAPAIFFDGLVQKSVLDLFFLCALLFLLSAAIERAAIGPWLAAGATAGALVLSRENALVIAAVIFVWIALRGAGAPVERARWAAAFALGLSLLLAPVALRNLAVGGGLHLTTSQLGTNFWIGNNPDANGRYAPLVRGRGSAKYERIDATLLAERAVGHPLSAGEVSRYWTGRSIAWITSEPGTWLGLLATKFALLWDALESVDTEDQYTLAEWSTPLRVTGRFGHFGALAPLATLGVFALWPRRRRLELLLALLSAYAASVVLFYVFARYRLPLVPPLLLLAAGGLTHAAAAWRGSSLRPRAICAASVVAVAVFSNWPLAPREPMQAVTYYNFGNAFKVDGRPEEAVRWYRRAIALEPGFWEARHNLAATWLDLDRPEEAAAQYRANLAANPDDALALHNLGNLLRQQGDLDAAIAHYRAALEVDERYAVAHENLASALVERRDPVAAAEHFERARELDPAAARSPGADRRLALAWLAADREDRAIGPLRRALEATPAQLDCLRPAVRILTASGDTGLRDVELAVALAEAANNASKGRTPAVLDVLASAYAAADRYSEAAAAQRLAADRLRDGEARRAERYRRRADRYDEADAGAGSP